jgi:hypothetical protein
MEKLDINIDLESYDLNKIMDKPVISQIPLYASANTGLVSE